MTLLLLVGAEFMTVLAAYMVAYSYNAPEAKHALVGTVLAVLAGSAGWWLLRAWWTQG